MFVRGMKFLNSLDRIMVFQDSVDESFNSKVNHPYKGVLQWEIVQKVHTVG